MKDYLEGTQRKQLSEKQLAFLEEFAASFSFNDAAKASGYQPSQVKQLMRRLPTGVFAKTYRKIQLSVIEDPRFNKCGSLERMYKWIEAAEENGDIKLALEIQKELNKMIDGNMAIQKQITENKKEVTLNVIDLTRPKAAIAQEAVEEYEYEDVEEEDDE